MVENKTGSGIFLQYFTVSLDNKTYCFPFPYEIISLKMGKGQLFAKNPPLKCQYNQEE